MIHYKALQEIIDLDDLGIQVGAQPADRPAPAAATESSPPQATEKKFPVSRQFPKSA